MSGQDVKFQAVERLNSFLSKRLGKYEVEVGLLEDAPAAKWKKERKRLAGGPANKEAGSDKNTTLREVFAHWAQVYNLLLAPLRAEGNKDVVEVIGRMVADLVTLGRQKQQFLNAVQALIRNPISRGDYGKNSKEWAKAKGFNRLLINTGKMFKNIKARFKNRV